MGVGERKQVPVKFSADSDDEGISVRVSEWVGWGWFSSTSEMVALQPSWHPCPPSPAGLASAPYSTEPPTGTTCKGTKHRQGREDCNTCYTSLEESTVQVFISHIPLFHQRLLQSQCLITNQPKNWLLVSYQYPSKHSHHQWH